MRDHIIDDDVPIPIFSTSPDISNVLEAFSINILEVGNDSIDAYIREGLQILDRKPDLNKKLENGWVR